MTRVTDHAKTRAAERWQLSKHPHIEDAILDTYANAESVGDYIENGRPLRVYVEKVKKRILIVNPVDDTIVTVLRSKNTVLAPVMYTDVITAYRKRIREYQAKRKAIHRRYERERATLESERDKLDQEIRRLTLQRDYVDGVLDNYRYDMGKLDEMAKSTVRSLANYLTYDESEWEV